MLLCTKNVNEVPIQGEEAALDVTSVYSLENPVLAPAFDPEVTEEEMELKVNHFYTDDSQGESVLCI